MAQSAGGCAAKDAGKPKAKRADWNCNKPAWTWPRHLARGWRIWYLRRKRSDGGNRMEIL